MPQESLFYLSFASDERWLGGLLTRAASPEEAFRRASGQNPGGEALILRVPPEEASKAPAPLLDRLLSRADLDSIWACTDLGTARSAGHDVDPAALAAVAQQPDPAKA